MARCGGALDTWTAVRVRKRGTRQPSLADGSCSVVRPVQEQRPHWQLWFENLFWTASLHQAHCCFPDFTHAQVIVCSSSRSIT